MSKSTNLSSEILAKAQPTLTNPATSSRPAEDPGAFEDGKARADLKQKSVSGGVIVIIAQAMTFCLQTGSMMILARLLSKADFGLQGMVLALTGVLALFRDAGLSVVTIQRSAVTHEQTSTLFWLNCAIGVFLAVLTILMAPLVAAFYREPRLASVAIVSASAFVLNGTAVQHRALLQRAMRFGALTSIDLTALAASVLVGVSMAATGWGYWSLVAMTITVPLLGLVGVWLAMPWVPGAPRRDPELRSMLSFAGAVTLNSLVVYVAYNAEKVLLGRYWGAETLGVYGRAYQLINLPMQQLNSAINGVAFPGLSRLNTDKQRLRDSFIKGYSVLVSATIPATVCCGVFAREIVRVVYGPNWSDVGEILPLLAPATVVLAIINPLGWVLQALGLVKRNLHLALFIAPMVIAGIFAGIPYGARGVALGFSTAMLLLLIPFTLWARAGTGITMKDIWSAVSLPLAATFAAGSVGWLVKVSLLAMTNVPIVLVLGILSSTIVYCTILLAPSEQRHLYRDLMTSLISRPRKV